MKIVTRALAEPLYPPADAYDLAAPYYDEWKWQAFWRRCEWPVVASWIDNRASLAGPPRLVDVGCGTGWYLSKLEPLCSALIGVDISAAMLARARTRIPHADLLQADVCGLPFCDQGFDVVLSTRVLSHVEPVDVALSEIVRITRREGLIILSDIDAQHDYRATRLPTAGGHVQAQTFKHARATISALLQSQGARLVDSELLSHDGDRIPLSDFAGVSSKPVVGWVSVWRRG